MIATKFAKPEWSFSIPAKNDVSTVTRWASPAGAGAKTGVDKANAYDATILNGLTGILPGTTLYLFGGTFNTTLTFGSSGTDGSYINVFNDPTDPATISGGGVRVSCVDINSKNYVHAFGFTVTAPTTNGVIVQGTSHHIYIGSIVSTASGNQAFQMLDTATAYYTDITGSGCVDDGFSMHDATTAYIDGGTFTGNAQGINTIGTSLLNAKGVRCYLNTTYDAWQTGTPTANYYGCKFESTVASAVRLSIGSIVKFYGCHFYITQVEVINNVDFYNCKFEGGVVDQILMTSAATASLARFFGCLFLTPGGSNKASIYAAAAATDCEVYNCTFVSTLGNTFGIAVRINNGATAIMTNCLVKGTKYGTYQASTGTFTGSNNNFYGCATQHQGTQSLAGTTTVDPLFKTGDTIQGLLQNSPMIGAGVVTGYPNFILSNSTFPTDVWVSSAVKSYNIGAVVNEQKYPVYEIRPPDYPTIKDGTPSFALCCGETTDKANGVTPTTATAVVRKKDTQMADYLQFTRASSSKLDYGIQTQNQLNAEFEWDADVYFDTDAVGQITELVKIGDSATGVCFGLRKLATERFQFIYGNELTVDFAYAVPSLGPLHIVLRREWVSGTTYDVKLWLNGSFKEALRGSYAGTGNASAKTYIGYSGNVLNTNYLSGRIYYNYIFPHLRPVEKFQRDPFSKTLMLGWGVRANNTVSTTERDTDGVVNNISTAARLKVNSGFGTNGRLQKFLESVTGSVTFKIRGINSNSGLQFYARLSPSTTWVLCDGVTSTVTVSSVGLWTLPAAGWQILWAEL